MAQAKTFSQTMTPGGYLMGEVASALQKEIRRGHEREALFWATEIDLAGYGGYVWKRLKIIASEDVGLASTETVVAVRALYENWVEQKRGSREGYEGFYRVFMLNAVCLLCRAPKSRMLDHALMIMYGAPRPPLRIPDYALDQHTGRGRKMGRGMEHFLDVGSQLENVGLDDPYAAEARGAMLRPTPPKPPAQADDDGAQLDLE